MYNGLLGVFWHIPAHKQPIPRKIQRDPLRGILGPIASFLR